MYAVFFDYNGTTYRMPTNPEEISVSSTQAVEKYNVLKLGQIAVPTHMELKEYSFECEFPHLKYSYVKVKEEEEFLDAKRFMEVFARWRKQKVPVRFIAGCTTKKGVLYGDSINTLVLIQEMSISEKAGEEGDKYVSFKLTEYRDFDKTPYYEVKKDTGKGGQGGAQGGGKDVGKKIERGMGEFLNPKKKGYYVVAKGDTLLGISKKIYGNGAKFSEIMLANPGVIKNPALLEVGRKLVIP